MTNSRWLLTADSCKTPHFLRARVVSFSKVEKTSVGISVLLRFFEDLLVSEDLVFSATTSKEIAHFIMHS